MTKPIFTTNRRDFLKLSTAAGVGAVVLGPALAARPRRPDVGEALGDRPLRLALVGCGGRGTGAVADAFTSTGPLKLVAMADAFRDRLDQSYTELKQHAADRVDVPDTQKFTGFDAYQKAIDCDVDVVILTTPPGFRPLHFEYAIAKNRHVFMEKPVGVDAPGVRRVLKAAAEAKARNLKVGVGLQRHHSAQYREIVKRIQGGAIGDLVLLRVYWNSSGVWTKPRQPNMTEMEYQMRNWYYFNWLCGDHIVEQHIHNLDVGNWLAGSYPVTAQGQGGRQVRTGPDTGEIFDHHMVEFTYGNGVKMLSQCRHIPDCYDLVAEFAHGSRGSADVSGGKITGADGKFEFKGDEENPYEVEHHDLFAAIRSGTPYNEAENGAYATMTAIMGRMATYSGKVIRWEEALASELDLSPKSYDWKASPRVLPDAHGNYPYAKPGATQAL